MAKRTQAVEAADLANLRPVGRPETNVDKNESDVNIRLRPAGNSAAAAMRRLRKDRPDSHARAEATPAPAATATFAHTYVPHRRTSEPRNAGRRAFGKPTGKMVQAAVTGGRLLAKMAATGERAGKGGDQKSTSHRARLVLTLTDLGFTWSRAVALATSRPR
jgi:hypothetical protein